MHSQQPVQRLPRQLREPLRGFLRFFYAFFGGFARFFRTLFSFFASLMGAFVRFVSRTMTVIVAMFGALFVILAVFTVLITLTGMIVTVLVMIFVRVFLRFRSLVTRSLIVLTRTFITRIINIVVQFFKDSRCPRLRSSAPSSAWAAPNSSGSAGQRKDRRFQIVSGSHVERPFRLTPAVQSENTRKRLITDQFRRKCDISKN